MRSITRVSIRSASCLGAVALAGASWFGASPAQADEATPSPVPSTSEAPAPSSTPVPSAPADEKITTVVWWLLPAGADPSQAHTYTQTRIATGSPIPCDGVVQADTYHGTPQQIEDLGPTLTPGEDSEVYQDSTIIFGEKCETPAPTLEPTPEPTPEPSETEPTTPVPSPEPSDSDVPVPPVTVTVPPSQVPSDLPMPPTETEPTVVVVVTEKPADLPLPATNNGRRPTALPHTGDASDGVSPYGIGAGICAIAFAGSFVGRRKK